MAEKSEGESAQSRPKASHTSRSFTRMDDPPPSPSTRVRAGTLPVVGGVGAGFETKPLPSLPDPLARASTADIFEHSEDDEQAQTDSPATWSEPLPHTGLEELPIEIRSLTERFLDRLSAKVHPTPLGVTTLSEMFQEFYERAASHIATHIASLSTRMARERSPAGVANLKNPLLSRSPAGSGARERSSDSLSSLGGGEMLTATEVADRKRARRLLELKKTALEEAVERVVCEKVYHKIWKHRSADDDERDEKLRSRTASLMLVGIGLKELHMDSDPSKADVRRTAIEKEDEIHRSLAPARESLQNMDLEHYPLGKLRHLTAAHKSIVETLSQLFPSSSSADEILPTLIYTLITSPPESISVVSNLNFIQRFRATNKVDGEAAYCLVNLEAAISFLETVDLSSLRDDELPSGPPKPSSRPLSRRSTDSAARPNLAPLVTPDVSITAATAESRSALPLSPTKDNPDRPNSAAPHTPHHARRLSVLMQAQADRLEAGRDNLLNAADKIYESINGTLDNSLQFLFGRFKEQVGASEGGGSPIPKTLEDARKLVSPRIGTTATAAAMEDDGNVSTGGGSSPALDDPLSAAAAAAAGGGVKADNKTLDALVQPAHRDRSVDSARSGGSASRRVAFVPEKQPPPPPPPPPQQQAKDEPLSAGGATTTLFAAMNPLNRLPGFPRFGRAGGGGAGGSVPSSVQPSPFAEKAAWMGEVPSPLSGPQLETGGKTALPAPVGAEKFPNVEESSAGLGIEELSAREALAELRQIKPPRKRFLEVPSAEHLQLGEVQELLRDYRRLAKAIGEAIAM